MLTALLFAFLSFNVIGSTINPISDFLLQLKNINLISIFKQVHLK